ncbi:MAG: sulfatase, partial [bacterium]
MSPEKNKPNLLILTPDQYRADYISAYGHPTIGTKNIDRLAREGVRFDKLYCAAPLCGPSRISFATSMRFSEHGRRNYASCIDYNVPNLVSTLRGEGYRAGMFGKNHLFLTDQLPLAWDELHEVCLGNYDRHPDYHKSFSAFPLADDHEYNITAQLADEAVDFIDRCPDDQPFFCWVNWQDPHPAFTCPEPYASLFNPDDIELPASWTREDKTKPQKLENWRVNSAAIDCTEAEARKAIATYMGQCRYVDDQVGKLVDHLERTGKLENTVILFFSDHGELLGDYGVFHKIPVFHESLARIPGIMRLPRGMAKPCVFDGLAEEVDLAPTLLDFLGLDRPASMVGQSWRGDIESGHVRGRSSALVEAGIQIPTQQEPIPGANQRAPFQPNNYGPGAMVTDGRYKLSMYCDDRHELYDLETDPGEVQNLWDNPDYADIQKRLNELLVQRLLGVGLRPAGPWPGPGVDVRESPPESRNSQWHGSGQI